MLAIFGLLARRDLYRAPSAGTGWEDWSLQSYGLAHLVELLCDMESKLYQKLTLNLAAAHTYAQYSSTIK